VQRAIVAFELDGQGEWVAELACGHRRHVRHQPPLFPELWILEAGSRDERLGTPLDCRLCDQGGESACLSHLVCPDCGAVLDGGSHRPNCASAA
jgi:hypothetical protein